MTPKKNSLAAEGFRKAKKQKVKVYKVAAKIKKTSAWTAFANFIKKRDKYTCITCGRRGEGSQMNAGHFVSASGHLSVLFSEENVFAQCTNCNIRGDEYKGIYTLKLIDRFGREYVDNLVRKGSEYHPGFTREDLKAILTKYQQP